MGTQHLSLSPFEEEKWSSTFYYLEEQEVNFCSDVISNFGDFLYFLTHDLIKFRIFDQCNLS